MGSQKGVLSDADGNFEIKVPEGTVLEISYLGFVTQQVKAQRELKVTMREDYSQLEETVVVGYGTVKKRDLTGSISSIKQADIVAVPTTNALESLQGKVAGLDMTKSSGQAGSGISFTVRGNRSLNASNAPLILVDGMPYSSDVDINPESIESIEVLKDASSTAIYGSRGANGVIIITTKRAKGAKSNVAYSGYYSFDQMSPYPELQNTQQYAQMLREAYRTTGAWTSTDDDAKIFMSAYDFIKNDVNIDWIDLVSRKGYTTSHSVTLSHAGDRTSFNASLQYLNQKGIIYNDDMERYTGNISLTHKINSQLTFDANAIISITEQNRGQDPYNMAVKYGPWGEPYNEDGTVKIYPYNDGQTISPLAETIEGNFVDNTKTYRTYVTGGMTWNPLKGLVFKSEFNANLNHSRRGRYWGSYTVTLLGDKSKAQAEQTNADTYTWETTANYNFTLANDHEFTLLAGNEMSHSVTEKYLASGRDLLSEAMSFHNLEALQSQQAIESQYTKQTMVSWFGRLNYKWRDRYLLTATVRADGSSVLAEGHKWGVFPSVAAGWRINEESWMASTKDWLYNLKLRASWGVSGNSAVSAYQTGGGLGTTMYVFDTAGSEVGQYGYWPQAIPNHDLSWEKTQTTDIGLDAAFLDSRISLSFDWYLQNTSDLLMQKQIPVTNGYTSTWANVGKTRNTGVELVLNTMNVKTRSFSWSSDITFTHNHEEIRELASGQERDIDNGWFVGEPTKVYYATNKLGIWQLGEEAEAAKYGYKPGQVKNEDLDNDGKITGEDRMVIGSPRPDFVIGFNNRLTYRDFGLSFFLVWRHGSEFQMNNFWSIGALQRTYSYIDYWTPENPTNDFPRPDRSFAGSDISLSGLNYYDGSFVKLRDITIDYSLPRNLCRKSHLESAKVYCTAKNFFQWNNLPVDGYDAERQGSYGYPTIRQLVVGVNINF